MINLILADNTAFLFIGLALIVLMMVMTFLPQRKRQKQMQQMMQQLAVGTRIKTIGGIIGKIKEIKDDGTLVIDVGTEEFPTILVIDKVAVYSNLDAMEAAAAAKQAAVTNKKNGNNVSNNSTDADEKKIDE